MQQQVALLAEGVDRNGSINDSSCTTCTVALLAEGVDRNIPTLRRAFLTRTVALLAEGVDRNAMAMLCEQAPPMSPSSRRAWIEIGKAGADALGGGLSPSSRRAWIEIYRKAAGR